METIQRSLYREPDSQAAPFRLRLALVSVSQDLQRNYKAVAVLICSKSAMSPYEDIRSCT